MNRKRLLILSCILLAFGAGNAFAAGLDFSVAPSLTPGAASYQALTNVTLDFTVQNNGSALAANKTVAFYVAASATCTSSSSGVFLANAVITAPLAGGGATQAVSKVFQFANAHAGATRYVCVKLDSDSNLAIGPFAITVAAPPSAVPTAGTPNIDPGQSIVKGQQLQDVDFGVTVSTPPVAAGNLAVKLNISGTCSAGDPLLVNIPYTGTATQAFNNVDVTIPLSAPATATAYLCATAGGTTLRSANSFAILSNAPTIAPVTPTFAAGQTIAQGAYLQDVDFGVDVTNPPVAPGNMAVKINTSGTCSAGDPLLVNIPYTGTTDETFADTDVLIPNSAPLGTAYLCVTAGGTTLRSATTFTVVASAPNVITEGLKLFGPWTTERPGSGNPTPHIRPATLSEGDTLTVTFDVYNRGNRASSSAIGVLRYATGDGPCQNTDVFLLQFQIPGLAVDEGESYEFTGLNLNADLDANQVHRLCVDIDTTNTAGQTLVGKADDNAKEIFVGGVLPDLVPVNISVSPNPVPECLPVSRTVRTDSYGGCTAELTFDVYNQGKGPSEAITHVRAYVSDFSTLAGGHVLGTEGDVELMIAGGPCVLPSARGLKTDALIQTDNCVPVLAPGAMQGTYSAIIDIPPVWGGASVTPSDDPTLLNGASRNEDGSFSMVAYGYPSHAYTEGDPGKYAVVTWRPGRYIWVKVDSENEGGQTLDELIDNDAQKLFVAGPEILVSDLNQIGAEFSASAAWLGWGSPRLSIMTDGDPATCDYAPYNSPAGDGPCPSNIIALFGDASDFAGTVGELNYYSCENLAATPGIGDDNGRWDDSHLVGGSPYTTFPQVVARQGSARIQSVSFVIDDYDTTNLQLYGIHVNTGCSY
jgi:hypothetical protein